MKRDGQGILKPEMSDISQSILLLTVRQAKMNSLVNTLVEMNKENNRELRKLRKAVKGMK